MATGALVGLLAFYWEPDEKRKHKAALAALALAAVCPFTTIYAATILTEVPTMFLAVAITLAATLGFRNSLTTEDTEGPWRNHRIFKHSLFWWCIAGLLAGLAVLLRPDSGLFAAAIGFTLLLTGVGPSKKHLSRVFAAGAAFSLPFVLALAPWTIRNARIFHRFQPLAPAHGEMPGEFVAHGYNLWLRTWLDHERYIGPFLWALDESPITLDLVPASAFDSQEEEDRVAALLDQYNHPPSSQIAAANPSQPSPPPTPQASPTQTPIAKRFTGKIGPTPLSQSEQNSNANQSINTNANRSAEGSGDEDSGDQGDENRNDESDEADNSDAEEHGPVEMTPDIDAGFAQLARERIARHPIRFYLWLPIKRAGTMWLDTHSQYWPWEGDLLPLEDLDREEHQQIWLPLFAGLTAIYTLLGLAGAWLLWRGRKFEARRWLLLVSLVILFRLVFFSTIENPEPRYLVEFFPFLSALGGIALPRIPGLKRAKPLS
jgi:4-amino-4-deoxy-L-arabinose transferase-like glycosyltransferase